MRVLIVEDEQALRDRLRDQLRKEGYAVDVAEDGQEGLFMGREYAFDLAIIDLGLPKLNGVDVIKTLREDGKTWPILVLTARGRWQDKVEGLEAGADDYLVKPFQLEELLARMKALLRRSVGVAKPRLDYGPIQLDTGAQEIRVNGTPVELTAYEYKLLEYLMLHSGEVVSKTVLTEHIYDQDFDRDSNVIEVFVGRLRKKLDPDNSYKPIETLRGRGYRFTLNESTA
jgi:two-component system response regulator PhoP